MTNLPGSADNVESVAALIASQTALYTAASQKDEKLAQSISNACAKLTSLVANPAMHVMEIAWGYSESVAICLALDMDLFRHVAVGQTTTSLQQLAKLSGASITLLKRVMHLCAHRSIFEEVLPGEYRHTRLSEVFLDEATKSRIHGLVDEGLMCEAFLSTTIRENGFQIPTDRYKSAFCKAFNTKSDLYKFYHTDDPVRGARFALGMADYYNGIWEGPPETVFPFHALEKGATLVDVGGGRGQHSLRLGAKYQQLHFVVQDHKSVIDAAKKEVVVSPSMQDRILWQPHDFYTPQPTTKAEIYLVSHVLMDHNASECQQIIRHLADAMDPKTSRLLIHDNMDFDQTGAERSLLADQLDFYEIAVQNAGTRSMRELEAIITGANEGLVLEKVWNKQMGAALLEFRLV